LGGTVSIRLADKPMDYELFDFFFGLCLILTTVLNLGLCVLLSKVRLPILLACLSWAALTLNLFAAMYIEYLFLQRMVPAFNRRISLGLLLFGSAGALLTVRVYRRAISPRAAGVLFGMQMLTSLASLVIALLLYGSMVPT